ncbi:MAG: hypothetical protein ABH821_05135 [archaeon]
MIKAKKLKPLVFHENNSFHANSTHFIDALKAVAKNFGSKQEVINWVNDSTVFEANNLTNHLKLRIKSYWFTKADSVLDKRIGSWKVSWKELGL